MGRRLFVIVFCASCFLTAACEADITATPAANLTIAAMRPRPWPAAPQAPPQALPQIVKIWMSSTELREGATIDGAVATSTNVASLEVRTATFSINAPRIAFGQFRFRLKVLVFPPLMKRGYSLLFIARNAAGQETIEYTPLELR